MIFVTDVKLIFYIFTLMIIYVVTSLLFQISITGYHGLLITLMITNVATKCMGNAYNRVSSPSEDLVEECRTILTIIWLNLNFSMCGG